MAKNEIEKATGQVLMPGHKLTALEKAEDAFVAARNTMQKAKLKMEEAGEEVIAEMENAKVTAHNITIGTANYRFKVKGTKKQLSCTKITRDPNADKTKKQAAPAASRNGTEKK